MSQDGMRPPTISILVLMPKLAVGVGSYIVCGNNSNGYYAGTFADNPYTLNRAAYQDGSMRLKYHLSDDGSSFSNYLLSVGCTSPYWSYPKEGGTYYNNSNIQGFSSNNHGSLHDNVTHQIGGGSSHPFLVGISWIIDYSYNSPACGVVYYSGCSNFVSSYPAFGSRYCYTYFPFPI